MRRHVLGYDLLARRLAAVRAVGMATAFLLLWVVAACLVDRAFALSPWIRVGLLLGGLAGVGVIVGGPLRRWLRRRVDWSAAAARVETMNPRFAEGLMTAASRLTGPRAHRGSEQMLRALLADMERRLAATPTRPPLPLGRLLRPWLLATLAAATAAALSRAPSLGFGRLTYRLAIPWSSVDPVTTANLEVETGDRDVVQSQPTEIVARAHHAGPPVIFTSVDGRNWTHTAMVPSDAGDGRFRHVMNAVNQDTWYFVRAGDATSSTYLLRSLRRPAVADLRVRYLYPPYTDLAPLSVGVADGLIEAPPGTTVELTIQSTELLAGASILVAGEPPNPMSVDPVSRQAIGRVTVKGDARYALQLTSDRHVTSEGVASGRIHMLPDLRPLARLMQTGGLRLNPCEIVPLSYQAMDDYGLASVSLNAQVNGGAPIVTPIELTRDLRRQEGSVEFDLATLSASIGDTVTLTLVSADKASQSATSEPLQILISPRSIDLASYRRIADLSSASQLATSLADQWSSAAAALADAPKAPLGSTARQLVASRANRHLSGSAEAAGQLRQTLLRVVVNSRSAELSQALAGWIDMAQIASSFSEDLFRRNSSASDLDDSASQRAASVLNDLRELARSIQAASEGERAVALLNDRENLMAAEARSHPTTAGSNAERETRSIKMAERARSEWMEGVRALGLDPASDDVDNRLHERVNHAAQTLHAAARPDFPKIAAAWAARPAAQTDDFLDERLSAAAHAEALRNDADLQYAFDLQMSARAASHLKSMMRMNGRDSVGDLGRFSTALAALAHEAEFRRANPSDARDSASSRSLADAAKAGRRMMEHFADALYLAAAVEDSASVSTSSRFEAEDLALKSGALSVARDYEKVAEADKRLHRKLAGAGPDGSIVDRSSPFPLKPDAGRWLDRIDRNFRRVEDAMTRAERLDRLEGEQGRLADADVSSDLTRQQRMADAIARVHRSVPKPAGVSPDDPMSRDRAITAVLTSQEELAAIPQRLSAFQEAFAAQRQLAVRAEMARRQLEQAESSGDMDFELRDAARGAVEQANRDTREAADRTLAALGPVGPAKIELMVSRLEPFAPETAGAVYSLSQRLTPALGELDRAARSVDTMAAARAVEEARGAIEFVQRELSRAQEAFMRRDPLVAAKWFARGAADSLSQQPPNLQGARQLQRGVVQALSLAWDQSIHEAAASRMASLPALQRAYDAPADASSSPTPSRLSPTLFPNFVSGWDWGRLQAAAMPHTDASPSREADPPGFEEPLRLYFDALSAADAPTTQRTSGTP